MRMNPNLVPWMGLIGLLGLGLAYAGGRMMGVADPMVCAWVGLIVGVFVGLLLRIFFRFRGLRKGQGEPLSADEGSGREDRDDIG